MSKRATADSRPSSRFTTVIGDPDVEAIPPEKDSVRFPALSVRQPWVDLILLGAKDVENRGRRTHFRGTILLHASATRPDPDDIAAFEKAARKAGELGKLQRYAPVLGALVGTVDITDSVTSSESIWFTGPYGWVLANPRRFPKPVPYKGAVGVFYVPQAKLAGTHAARMRPGSSRAG